jgi:hypothetical protein
LLLTVGPACADGEKVPLDKLPQKVVDAVKAKFPKAELKHAYKDTVDGKTVYEVGINIEKQHVHAMVTAEGKLYEIHKDIDAKDLPAAVTKAVSAKYPKGKVGDVEEQTNTDGKVIGYQIELEVGSDIHVMVVDPAGKIVSDKKTPKDGK